MEKGSPRKAYPDRPEMACKGRLNVYRDPADPVFRRNSKRSPMSLARTFPRRWGGALLACGTPEPQRTSTNIKIDLSPNVLERLMVLSGGLVTSLTLLLNVSSLSLNRSLLSKVWKSILLSNLSVSSGMSYPSALTRHSIDITQCDFALELPPPLPRQRCRGCPHFWQRGYH